MHGERRRLYTFTIHRGEFRRHKQYAWSTTLKHLFDLSIHVASEMPGAPNLASKASSRLQGVHTVNTARKRYYKGIQ